MRLMSIAAMAGGAFLASKMLARPSPGQEAASATVPEAGQAAVPTHAKKAFPINTGPPKDNVMKYDQSQNKTLDQIKQENNAKIEEEAASNWLVKDIMGFVGGLFGEIS